MSFRHHFLIEQLRTRRVFASQLQLTPFEFVCNNRLSVSLKCLPICVVQALGSKTTTVAVLLYFQPTTSAVFSPLKTQSIRSLTSSVPVPNISWRHTTWACDKLCSNTRMSDRCIRKRRTTNPHRSKSTFTRYLLVHSVVSLESYLNLMLVFIGLQCFISFHQAACFRQVSTPFPRQVFYTLFY